MGAARRLTVCSLVCACLVLLLAVPAEAGRSPGARMLGQLNKVRAKHHLRPLRSSPALRGSAAGYSHWLMKHDVFAHRSRIRTSGHFRRLGEALAMTYGRRTGARTARRGGMRSAYHRGLVLTRSMNLAGVGATSGRFGRRRATIWVLQGGKR